MAEKIMLVLVDNGMTREESHEVLRSASMYSIENKINLLDVCKNEKRITDLISEEILIESFKPENHLGFSGKIVDNTLQKARELLN